MLFYTYVAKKSYRKIAMENFLYFKIFKNLINHRSLLYMLAWRDIKIKYKQSVMGILWAIFMPMLIVAAGMLVRFAFSVVSGKPTELADIASVSVRAVPWAFFVASIRFSTLSLISNTNLVTKIYFPRELFPFSSIISQFFDFLIASIVICIALTIAQVGINIQILWVPVLLLPLIILILGLGVLLSSLALFLRDVKYLVEVIMTFGIFFTPVFYDVKMFGHWAYILMLNPLAPILEGLSSCIVYHAAPDVNWMAYSYTVSIMIFLAGLSIFKKLESSFAENI